MANALHKKVDKNVPHLPAATRYPGMRNAIGAVVKNFRVFILGYEYVGRPDEFNFSHKKQLLKGKYCVQRYVFSFLKTNNTG